MILVLDACTISNLLHIVQDDSLIKLLNRAFSKVYITKEVIKEVDNNKFMYLPYYNNSRETINQLISDLKLNAYISDCDKDKYECTPFIKKFAIAINESFKDDEGELQSALLSLYLSRWGDISFMENNNKILFATDDDKANRLYIKLFSTNQIGHIIDSVDLLSIFYLKGLITKKDLIKNVDAIIQLYWFPLNRLKQVIVNMKNKDLKGNTQSYLTSLMEFCIDYQIEKIFDTLHDNGYKKIYSSIPQLKEAIKNLNEANGVRKVAYLKERHKIVSNNLIWDKHLT
jgi:hypothetical protein